MNLMDIIETIFFTVITSTLPIITTYIAKFLTTKRKQINTQIKNQKLNSYVDIALKAVNQAVISVTQTYVDSLKANGKFNKNAKKEAKRKAIITATAIITNDTKNAIRLLYGDFDKWLDSAIEKYVNMNK